MPGLQRGETSSSRPEEVEVSAVLDMSMSLDGSIADPNGFLGEGTRLYDFADGSIRKLKDLGRR